VSTIRREVVLKLRVPAEVNAIRVELELDGSVSAVGWNLDRDKHGDNDKAIGYGIYGWAAHLRSRRAERKAK